MNLLPVIIVLPLLTGIVSLVLPNWKKLREIFVNLGLIASFYIALKIFLEGSMPFAYDLLDFGSFNMYFLLSLSKLKAVFLLFINLFAMLIGIYSINFMAKRDRKREYYFYFSLVLAFANGVILANHFIFFLIFWELVALMLYLLITINQNPQVDKKYEASAWASAKTMAITGFSDFAMMLGIILIWSITGTFVISQINLVVHSWPVAIAFILLLIGALTKAGAMPFHTWIPAAAEGAPITLMAFLPAALDKLLGIFFLLQISIYLFTIGFSLKLLLMIIGAITIVAAVMMALVQKDLKRLLSYHAISQVGYMVLGIGTGTVVGVAGGLFHMLNHTIYKSCLFLCGGAVEKNTKVTDLSKLGGLGRLMPVTFFACFISALAISGVPPLNGFFSKWMIYQGVIESGNVFWPIFLFAAMFGSALTLASFMKLLFSTFLGEKVPQFEKIKEVPWLMLLPMIILAAASLLFGIFAQFPLKHFIFPALNIMPAKLLFSGIWDNNLATIFIFVGIALGFMIYFVGKVKARTSPSFFGGENLSVKQIKIKGTEFYNEIKTMKLLAPIYKAAEKGFFDIYTQGKKIVFFFTYSLKKLHTGVLTNYLSWCLIGLIVLLLIIVRI